MLRAHASLLRELVERCETLRRRSASGGSAEARRQLEDVAYTLCVVTGTRELDSSSYGQSHPGGLPAQTDRGLPYSSACTLSARTSRLAPSDDSVTVCPSCTSKPETAARTTALMPSTEAPARSAAR
jgi:hypothetical protein